jgi:aryl-alcohol dehydrogenase-like predicted oxidoreductase
MTFGEDLGWGSSAEESRRILDTYLDAGGNFIDTANVYTNGTSERFLGEFLEGRREEVVLGTKYTNAANGKDPNAGGNHRKSMMQSVEASLKRLRTDYIDLYWLHIWDGFTPIDEIMRAFDDLVRQGKILYCGISDAPAWVISRANTMAELRGWSRFVAIQVEYSLIERTPERDLLPMAKSLELAVTAWSPLASGILTGKYSKKGGAASDGSSRLNIEAMSELVGLDEERKHHIAARVAEVAKEIGESSARVALAWLLQRPQPVIPIIGARKLDQLKDNLASTDLKLDSSQLIKLDEASRVELGFPRDLLNKEFVRNLVYGGMFDSINQPYRRD